MLEKLRWIIINWLSPAQKPCDCGGHMSLFYNGFAAKHYRCSRCGLRILKRKKRYKHTGGGQKWQ